MIKMAHYNFKKITVVPTSKDFTDVVLSKTQRKTPTQIHRHFKVSFPIAQIIIEVLVLNSHFLMLRNYHSVLSDRSYQGVLYA